jgi:hypothetical protein
MSKKNKKFGDPRKRSVNHSKSDSNTSIVELETNFLGWVKDNSNLIKIKLWKLNSQNKVLKGTITFTRHK